MDAQTKAELLAAGRVAIDEKLLGQNIVSSAGPGAGKVGFFFNSGGLRVKLGADTKSPLKAIEKDGKICIYKDEKLLACGQIEEELLHCPEQAYINITETCIFDCKFCPVPKLNGRVKSVEKVLDMIEKAHDTGKMKAISITAGVDETVEKEVERAVEVVRKCKRYHVPIGVSVYPTINSNKLLKEAGADEIKYNVETMDRRLYSELCGEQDLDFILDSLSEAVRMFGKNRVCSNFIIGLGENDETVMQGIQELVQRGVVPILRPAASHPLRKGEVNIERPSKERILQLTRFLREELDQAGLDTRLFRTMCLPCTGCDLGPHRDLG
ncbi:radical SAM protein [Methanohalophilus mahii]|uniref:Radical SAM domain protein n=1 Tax=Methanohalophilus mahii (strain ATCC 35705 / DSM 5219 / SLP) TaxID=547558 RepID=D5E8H5_METMS|nr:radical SAM protein [Methanohalophilus mahii]ADE37463.1 Radical SAM domain protein [Methanohalophilus mahii DSM 5219]